MSIKLFENCPPFPTKIDGMTIKAKVGNVDIDIDCTKFNIGLVDDSYKYQCDNILYLGKSAKGAVLVLRDDGTGTIYNDGAVRLNSEYTIPEAAFKFEEMRKGGCLNKHGSVRILYEYIYEKEDTGVLYSVAFNSPFVFSISKNSKLMEDLMNTSVRNPILLIDNDRLFAVDKNNNKRYPIIGEFIECNYEEVKVW